MDYTPFQFEDARTNLEDIIRRSMNEKSNSDSLVVDVLGEYDIVFKSKASQDRMSWEYYFLTIQKITLILKTAHSEKEATKRYSPDAVIGISNGGMIFADHLHRSRIYKYVECQFLSLWANRDRPGEYFEQKSNELMLEGLLKDSNKTPGDVEILLVDDNVSGGDTSKLAINFIKSYSPEINVRFLPLFVNREDILPRINDYLLWTHDAFQYTPAEIANLHFVGYRYFPYEKAISGH